MTDLAKQFLLARSVGTPLIAIETPDPSATIKLLATEAKTINIEGSKTTVPMIQWDIINGWQPVNKPGAKAIEKIFGEGDVASMTSPPVSQARAAEQLEECSILFMMNAHPFVVNNPQFIQAIWNLRNQFKEDNRTAVLLGPNFKFPPELQQDILVLDEPLPDDTQLAATVDRMLTLAYITEKTIIPTAVSALRGLAAFSAEQATAMSIIPGSRLDIDALWDRKRKLIKETPGLSVWPGPETFADLGGLHQAKTYFRRVIEGKDPPRVIVFIDEGEKAFAGATGQVTDSSGVSTGFLGTMLTYQQDTESDGVMFLGPPGCSKSAFAKAIANEAGVLCITLDLNGMKAGIVGESEARLRQALKIVTAVGGGRALFVMTCNRVAELPPELRRRYSDIFFFDLPDEHERTTIFDIYTDKYGIKRKEADTLINRIWTGDEIRRCCLKAHRLNMTLVEAAEYIVPVAKSSPDDVKRLREQANGRYLSASYPGVYKFDTDKAGKKDRRFADNNLN